MAASAKRTICLPADGLRLEESLFCGQSFSWQKAPGGTYEGVAGQQAARVWQDGDNLYVQTAADSNHLAQEEAIAFWRRYFALDMDYTALQAQFVHDKQMAACVACAPGIRVLRQPFFDALLSFIISQNNHIPRIYGIVQRLRQQLGRRLPGGAYSFPAPETLATLAPEALAGLRAGFRARYLLDAAQKVANGTVRESELRTLPTAEARQRLCLIKGVGPKVADCVLLFALGRWEVAPMDVWMKRALEQHFAGSMPACTQGNEGIAQQYIFHWMRTGRDTDAD